MTEKQPIPHTLLSVLAHPDDESFGMGGTLALYARRGVAVHLVCATRGEAGDVDEPYLEGFSTIAERREAELRCAAMKLGLAGVQFLGYRDSGMPGTHDNQHPQALINAPLEHVAAQVRSAAPQRVAAVDLPGEGQENAPLSGSTDGANRKDSSHRTIPVISLCVALPPRRIGPCGELPDRPQPGHTRPG